MYNQRTNIGKLRNICVKTVSYYGFIHKAFMKVAKSTLFTHKPINRKSVDLSTITNSVISGLYTQSTVPIVTIHLYKKKEP
jgi:hypothetical protein